VRNGALPVVPAGVLATARLQGQDRSRGSPPPGYGSPWSPEPGATGEWWWVGNLWRRSRIETSRRWCSSGWVGSPVSPAWQAGWPSQRSSRLALQRDHAGRV